jgi:hypothetical protein
MLAWDTECREGLVASMASVECEVCNRRGLDLRWERWLRPFRARFRTKQNAD